MRGGGRDFLDDSPLVAVGEVVWDIFPDRRVLGGAPVNVAYHLAALGLPVRVVTRVGQDELGESTMAALADLGLPLEAVQRDEELPTGQVRVEFGPDGEPRYEIVSPAAWDNIEAEKAVAAARWGGGARAGDALKAETSKFEKGAADRGVRSGAGSDFALVFGTLAQRDPRSRAAIRRLAVAASFCYYDVNLRPPFTTRQLVLESLEIADLVKVNGEELKVIGAWLELSVSREEIAADLVRRYGLQALVVTEGGDGAWTRTASATHRCPGVPTRVVDTVGAGDAFFAAMIAAYRAHLPWSEILERANRRGAQVASRPGATPQLS